MNVFFQMSRAEGH